jgi:hypothetical protein
MNPMSMRAPHTETSCAPSTCSAMMNEDIAVRNNLERVSAKQAEEISQE